MTSVSKLKKWIANKAIYFGGTGWTIWWGPNMVCAPTKASLLGRIIREKINPWKRKDLLKKFYEQCPNERPISEIV